MRKYLFYLMMAAAVMTFGACSPDEDYEPETPGIETPETPDDGEDGTPDEPENPEEPGDNPEIPSGDSKILVAYFSWGGTTQRMAEEIVRQTGADIFRIEPVVPYPTEYTPCTEVAREERTTMPVLPSREKWKTGVIMIRYSSVAPYGGGQLR